MGAIYLIKNDTNAIAAELISGKQVTICEDRIRGNLKAWGIPVPPEFKEKFNLAGQRVYPNDDPKVFAIAFEEIYFKEDLSRMGYHWEDKNVVDERQSLTRKERVNHIIDVHKQYQEKKKI